MPLVARPFCEALVEADWGEQSGPLVASLVLFLPPSLGMGMVSPFAVRLATQSVSSVGKVAGTLYALSTAGSIAGNPHHHLRAHSHWSGCPSSSRA